MNFAQFKVNDMPKNILEKLEALPRFIDSVTGFPCVYYDDLRAIIEQYKTEGAEPVAWMAFQGTFQMIADTKDKLPKQSQASAIPLFRHPSPDLVAELVKALEEEIEKLRAERQGYWEKGSDRWMEADSCCNKFIGIVTSVLAKAKEMMG